MPIFRSRRSKRGPARSNFGFGRPKDGLIQIAYTVPDVRTAMTYWTETMKAGPWFLAENFSGQEPVYLGEPCRALINAALGFAGTMQVELIELANDEPGIQRDAIRSRGYGFHHYGEASTNIEAARARCISRMGRERTDTSSSSSSRRVP